MDFDGIEKTWLEENGAMLWLFFVGGMMMWMLRKFTVGRRTMRENFKHTQELLENLQRKLEEEERIRNGRILTDGSEVVEPTDDKKEE